MVIVNSYNPSIFRITDDFLSFDEKCLKTGGHENSILK